MASFPSRAACVSRLIVGMSQQDGQQIHGVDDYNITKYDGDDNDDTCMRAVLPSCPLMFGSAPSARASSTLVS